MDVSFAKVISFKQGIEFEIIVDLIQIQSYPKIQYIYKIEQISYTRWLEKFKDLNMKYGNQIRKFTFQGEHNLSHPHLCEIVLASTSASHAIEVQAGVFSTFMFMEKNPIDFKLFLEVIRSQNIFLRLIEDPEKIQSTLITRLSHLLNCKSICWALSGNIPSADR